LDECIVVVFFSKWGKGREEEAGRDRMLSSLSAQMSVDEELMM